jgi:predicted transposase YdaD
LEVSRPLTASEFEGLKEQLPKEARELMETMASTWIKEGMQKGRQEGLREGLREGRREAGVELTLRLLQRQIGEVSPRTQARIRKLSFEQLAELSEALLDFKSTKDLTTWLPAQAGKT